VRVLKHTPLLTAAPDALLGVGQPHSDQASFTRARKEWVGVVEELLRARNTLLGEVRKTDPAMSSGEEGVRVGGGPKP
jgi:hypothetical protein